MLLPASRPGIGTGVTLGMGRIVGDTAIVVILLGASQTLQAESGTPVLGALKGTGSTLTTYVYNNSPAGEGGAPEKAYAAAFVLLLIVIGLNFAIDLIASQKETGVEPVEGDARRTLAFRPRCGGSSSATRRTWPPLRRQASAHRAATGIGPQPPSRRLGPGSTAADQRAVERMRTEQLSVAYGSKLAVNQVSLAGSPGRGAGADRALGLRQDDPAALAQPPGRPDADGDARAAASCSTATTSTASTRPTCAAGSGCSSSSPTRSR